MYTFMRLMGVGLAFLAVSFGGVRAQDARPSAGGPTNLHLLDPDAPGGGDLPAGAIVTHEPDTSPKCGEATSRYGATDTWDEARSADFLRRIATGGKDICLITGRDPEGGYIWYRRVLGHVSTGSDDDGGNEVVTVELGREYRKYVGTWDPDIEEPPHPFR